MNAWARTLRDWIGRVEAYDGRDETIRRASPVVRVLVLLYRFIQITLREFLQDKLLLKSAALTFASLLALVPLLVISFSLFKLFGGAEWFTEVLRPILLRNLAPGSGPAVAQRVQQVIEGAGGATLGGVGVILLVLTVYGIFTGIESTFNGIWGVRRGRGPVHRLPLYWGLVTIIPILVIGSFAITTYIIALPLVHQAVSRVGIAVSLVNRLLPGLMVMIGFYLLYQYVPNARVARRAALLGAVVAGLMYEGVKGLFIFYTGKLVQYDVIYGSLAALPLLMVWINLSWIVVLAGVEVSFVSQYFGVLLAEPKHLRLSRRQQDALAYLMLAEATAAFRGLRERVTLEEWGRKWNIPPSVREEIAGRLFAGDLIRRTGPGDGEILLARDPDRIPLSEVEAILAGEANTDWEWPGDSQWSWLRDWIDRRKGADLDASGTRTLGEVVSRMSEESVTAARGDSGGEAR